LNQEARNVVEAILLDKNYQSQSSHDALDHVEDGIDIEAKQGIAAGMDWLIDHEETRSPDTQVDTLLQQVNPTERQILELALENDGKLDETLQGLGKTGDTIRKFRQRVRRKARFG
jgi:hypothetical protein